MIQKINKYVFWLVLTLLVSVALIFLSKDYSLNNIAMVFLLTLGIFTSVHMIIEAFFKFQAPSYYQYNQDIFYDTQWNWDWNLKKEILHLKPTCPTCKSEVFYSFDTLLNQTEFVCEKCNKQIANVNSSHRNFVVESVKKSIIRKLKKEDSSF